VLVADAFDALTSDPHTGRASPSARPWRELRAYTGTQFCPQVMAALEALYREQPAVLGAVALRVVGPAAA
jgi:HD-GYP domain-containing protein (c-di-GMP phosphodiesterase class II)